MDSNKYCNTPDRCKHLIQEPTNGGLRTGRFLCVKYTTLLNTHHDEEEINVTPNAICRGRFKIRQSPDHCKRKEEDCRYQICLKGKCVYDNRLTSNITLHE